MRNCEECIQERPLVYEWLSAGTGCLFPPRMMCAVCEEEECQATPS